MNINCQKLFNKTVFWLIAEIWLNLIGIDDLADYSEFVFQQELDQEKKNHRTVRISEIHPNFCDIVYEYCPITFNEIELINLQIKAQINNHCTIINSKCKQLKNPCIKIWCLPKICEIHHT